MMSDPNGSDNKVKRDRDVNTFAVSSVVVPSLFCAKIENTAKVRIGDATGEI